MQTQHSTRGQDQTVSELRQKSKLPTTMQAVWYFNMEVNPLKLRNSLVKNKLTNQDLWEIVEER